MTKTDDWKKIRAGLYEKQINGVRWYIENFSKSDGFANNEWHLGPDNDPHADQFKTFSEAVESAKYL